MSHWWRAYDHSVDNAKLQRLSGDLFKFWYNLCCLASANDGALPPLADVAFKLRLSETKARNVIETLQTAKLIDGDGSFLQMHDWNEYQYKSDLSTERVKRSREKKRNVSCNVSSDVSETGDETESERSVKRNCSVSSSLLSSSATTLESKEDSEEQACGPKGDLRVDFEIWYALYPHKVSKGHAFKAFAKVRKSGVDLATLIAGRDEYIRTKPPEIDWCYPATWLNGERWTDQPSQQNGHGHETAKDAGKREWNEARAKVRAFAAAPADGDVCEPTLRLLSAPGNRQS